MERNTMVVVRGRTGRLSDLRRHLTDEERAALAAPTELESSRAEEIRPLPWRDDAARQAAKVAAEDAMLRDVARRARAKRGLDPETGAPVSA